MSQTQKLVTFREPCDMTVAVSKAAEHLSGLGKYNTLNCYLSLPSLQTYINYFLFAFILYLLNSLYRLLVYLCSIAWIHLIELISCIDSDLFL